MTLISRRQFFKSLYPAVSVCKLGSIQDFPVGSKNTVAVYGSDLFVESLPEGIRVRNLKEQCYLKLSIGNDGQIYINFKDFWPGDVVLSTFTGEAYHIS